jgi:transposase
MFWPGCCPKPCLTCVLFWLGRNGAGTIKPKRPKLTTEAVATKHNCSIRPCGRNLCHANLTDSRIGILSNQCAAGIGEPAMLTGMTEDDWAFVLEVFRAVQSRRGGKGQDDRRFLKALHYFTVNNLSWRALPAEFGPWNTVWKRFWRLSQSGVFEAFFQALAGCSQTAGLIQMFDSTSIRAHVSAAGAKGGRKAKPSGGRVAGSAPKSTSSATSMACHLISI